MGIDYGRGVTNIDQKNGIRYGVIHQNEVLQAWADSSEPVYPELEEGEEENDFSEPVCFKVSRDGYTAEQGTDSGDIFLTKSDYFTLCNYCSPCAPGAGYLMSRGEDCRAYCFAHDWFEDGKAPYPVYRLSDGSEVLPDHKGECTCLTN